MYFFLAFSFNLFKDKYKGLKGDALQQGGIFVVGPDGDKILFSHANSSPNSHVSLEKIKKVISKL